ncbi:MAG: bifunctional 4-hydroxy-2-oxoglutarate aldolase/2-dehydro-3-deoxy-phosphogluconate aldolase [Nocardiopsaceae bacterium]|nr:bifunctional 4-hydroxy-2-oxoglutarate aldolase/2-dehydro-3-deoxy-phosphogluconate aldolase [Nocardiopsaceae bacterium]
MPDTVESLTGHGIVVIYRGLTPRQCLLATSILHEAGLRWFEVTMNSTTPLDTIRLLREEAPAGAHIGAGTVLDPDDVSRAADAGATFMISPHLDEKVVARTKDEGLISIPGAFTPTEMVRAVAAGADLVKVFPVRPVGAGYIKQVRAPLPDIPIFVSGGVDAALAAECFAQGAAVAGVGAQLLGGDAAATGDRERLTLAARELLDARRARQ